MQAMFRFHGELCDFLPPKIRSSFVVHSFSEPGSVKDAIEALGVPHPEVGALTINGRPAALAQLLADGDAIEVSPCPHDNLIGSCAPPGEPRFVLDVHLGTLARYLRMLGLDSRYRNDSADEELARVSAEQGRILLTRDVGLLKRSIVQYGRFLRAVRPFAQLQELVHRYALKRWAKPFTRCIACNGCLLPVAKDSVLALLPEQVALHFFEFRQCNACARVYWEGSHLTRMRAIVQAALGDTC